MKKLILIIIIIFSSCGIQKIPINPKDETTFTPELNETKSVEIGLTLFSKEQGQKFNAIKIKNSLKIKPGYLEKTIQRGDILINDAYTDKYNLYSYPEDNTYGIALPKNQKDKPMIYDQHSGIGINYSKPKNPLNYSNTFFSKKNSSFFKQEFIYNGRVGDGLKFIYREFVDNYARPSFTQNLQYDLSKSKIIGFRGLRIEVLNATNTNIKYKVLKPFQK